MLPLCSPRRMPGAYRVSSTAAGMTGTRTSLLPAREATPAATSLPPVEVLLQGRKAAIRRDGGRAHLHMVMYDDFKKVIP
jgi:hypothetical protein